MKHLLLVLSFIFSTLTSIQGQDIIVSDSVKSYYKLLQQLESAYNSDAAITVIDSIYGRIFSSTMVPEWVIANQYEGYAILLARKGDLAKSVEYYDKAFYSKMMLPNRFNRIGIQDFFKKDTALFQSKVKEYESNFGKIYSYQEIQIIQELYSMLSADQLARKFDDQQHNHALLKFTDSLTMTRMVRLIEENPQIKDPLCYVFVANFVLGRHIYSAYPEFWLTHIEPITRWRLMHGLALPSEYAYTYDRCVIFAKGENSYYGVFDNGGDNANPNLEEVNRHRDNIGLPPLGQKKQNDGGIFITY